METFDQKRPNGEKNGKKERNSLERVDLSICNQFRCTGVCSKGEMCSLAHEIIPMSRCLVFYHLYPNPEFFMQFVEPDELQLSSNDIQNALDAFYMDIYLEFAQFGEVEDLYVAGNLSPQMHGNVFVRFREIDSAYACHLGLEGRYYAGRIVHSTFVPVDKLSSVICSSFKENQCIHGPNCHSVHPLEPSIHVKIECFRRKEHMNPEALRKHKINPFVDSPYELSKGRSKIKNRVVPEFHKEEPIVSPFL